VGKPGGQERRAPGRFQQREAARELFGLSFIGRHVQASEVKKKLSEIAGPKGGLLIATDSLSGEPIAGAIVSGESEKEVMFLLKAMKGWLDRGIKLATIDFFPRLESGLKEVFPAAMLQRCVFHAVQLLTRGLNKELLRVRKQELLDYINE